MNIEKEIKEEQQWNTGEKSKVPYLERLELMNEWLQRNKEEILKNTKPAPAQDKPVVGFPD